MIKVSLEILAGLNETLDVNGKSDAVSLEQEIEEGETVSGLLNRLATGYPRFVQVVFDDKAQKLTERVSIFYNGRNLELANGLATELRDGDILTFVAPIIGG
jgi:molybdopterin converting factor small subunit